MSPTSGNPPVTLDGRGVSVFGDIIMARVFGYHIKVGRHKKVDIIIAPKTQRNKLKKVLTFDAGSGILSKRLP